MKSSRTQINARRNMMPVRHRYDHGSDPWYVFVVLHPDGPW